MSFMSSQSRGAAYGAIGGASLSALAAWLYYRRNKNKKNRILKTLGLMTGGAAIGAGIGLAIGRIRARQSMFNQAREESRSASSDKMVPGKIYYVNCYENRYSPDFEYGSLGYNISKKLAPNGMGLAHAMLATVDRGGNMKVMSLYCGDVMQSKRYVRDMAKKIKGGLDSNEIGLELAPSLASDLKYKYDLANGGLFPMIDVKEYSKGSGFYNKSTSDMANEFSKISSSMGYGSGVRVYECEVPDIGMATRAFNLIRDKSIRNGGGGYSAVPGGVNCGTVARQAFDIAAGNKGNVSHWLDMMIGGTATTNEPSTVFSGYSGRAK